MYINAGISYYDIMKDTKTFPDYYDYCKNNFETILYDVPLKHNVKEVIDKYGYHSDKELDVTAAAVKAINPSIKTIITDSTGEGFEAILGLKEVLNTVN